MAVVKYFVSFTCGGPNPGFINALNAMTGGTDHHDDWLSFRSVPPMVRFMRWPWLGLKEEGRGICPLTPFRG